MTAESVATVIVVSHNEGDHLRTTVASLLATSPQDVGVIVVDDHSSDGSVDCLRRLPRVRTVRPNRRLGVAGARNYGAALADGEVLVFSDAHVTAGPDWWSPLLAELGQGAAAAAPGISPMGVADAPGYGFTWRDATLTTSWLRGRPCRSQEVPMLCGCFLAVDRAAFAKVGGFDEGLMTWGLEDAELSLSLWKAGHRCVVVPTSQVQHLFRPRFHYHVDWSTTLYNVLRLAVTHFSEQALSRVIEEYADNAAFADAFARVVDSDVWLRRDEVASRSVHDASWFFDRFQIGALQ